jgi:hypothetical protein
MPLLERVRDGAELSQGDLLKEIRFVYLKDGLKPATWDNSYALVVTRDCQTERGSLVVARVTVNPSVLPRRDKEKPADEHFEDLRRLLGNLRDGSGTPDSMYLGTLPGEHKRVVAHFDQFCTIAPPAALAEWISQHRVATLSEPFRRALPARMFGAYAQVGHDDADWMCTPDLEALVSAGGECLAELDARVGRANYALIQARGGDATGMPKAPQSELTNATAAAEKFRKNFAPYQTALASRQKPLEEASGAAADQTGGTDTRANGPAPGNAAGAVATDGPMPMDAPAEAPTRPGPVAAGEPT